ncbi:MAG TPA: carbohydrate kinase family protein [Nocardioidaceae bacterium]|nr:carbohydrate kinase family protein [Nocardioidaceae bacterium]
MLACCVGEVMLDVIVETDRVLAADDDVPASITLRAGGQGANVAAWVAALGGRARLVGPGAPGGQGRLLADALAAAGVEPELVPAARAGTVVSLVSDGRRTLASDSGSTDWLDRLEPGSWLEEAAWLYVSGYALLRARDPGGLLALTGAAAAREVRVAVDLSSAAMIEEYGAEEFRTLWQRTQPDVVFAGDAEWSVCGAPGVPTLVRKHGPAGATFLEHGQAVRRTPDQGPVRDATGAGDALAAGFLLGGPDLAMRAAARCVATLGAQPR